MHTSVATQKLVSVTMSVEEWAEWLQTPETLMVQIENLALANVEPPTNGHKPARARRSPKAGKSTGNRTARQSKKTATTYDCPECSKHFKTKGRYERNMLKSHSTIAVPVAD